MTLSTHVVSYRTIDLSVDAERAVAHHRDACICSFGDEARFQGRKRYLKWLESKLEEFPDGFLMAFVGERCVGQLELEVPYGLSSGYANLFYVTEPFRGMGFGRALHERAVQYFKSWEANEIVLHCSPTNVRALAFYRSLGYRTSDRGAGGSLYEMMKTI